MRKTPDVLETQAQGKDIFELHKDWKRNTSWNLKDECNAFG